MPERTRLVGINHVALEVGDLDTAVEWYGRIFELEFREQFERMAFIDIGDQFLALAEVGSQESDRVRHFGLVVDDKEATRRRLEQVGAEIPDTRGLEFLDPWGNRVQVVDYRDIQFIKDERVLETMGVRKLEKTSGAVTEIRERGFRG